MIKRVYPIFINLILFVFLFAASASAQDVMAREYRTPEEIRGMIVSPGVDFAVQKNQSAGEVMAQIDKIIKNAKTYQLNTVYLNVQNREGVIYASDYYPVYTSFDALEYFLKKTKEDNIFTYIVFNPTSLAINDLIYSEGYITSDTIKQAQANITEIITKYTPDAILLDGYYNSFSEKSFDAYKLYSSGMGFEQWMQESVTSLIKSISDIIFKEKSDVQLGLVFDSVWANNTTVAEGSSTAAEFEMYTDAYIDLPTIFALCDIKTGLVKLPGAISDKTIPFKSTLEWWKTTLSNHGAEVSAVIYNDKLLGEEKGWQSPDQVIKQMIAVRETGSKGATFASYKELTDNKDNHTDLISKFYKDELKVQDILTDLAVSRPSELEYSTSEPQVSFYGASDPNFPLLLNDEEIERNDKGVFSLAIDLNAGLNTFVFTHKTKTVTYNITRNIKIIHSVSPEGAMTVEGNTTVPVSVYAYKGSSVTATVGGVTMGFVESSREDDNTDKNSGYVLYTANFSCPTSTQGEQNIGNIQVSATWQGVTQTATGANIRITSLPPPEIEVGQTGSMIEITASQARTYPSNVLNSDPSGDCFPLPQGSRDFIASDLLTFTSGGVNYSYYILRSGIRVDAADVKVIGDTQLVSNNITEATVYSESGFTYLRLKQDQPIAYKASLSGLGFSPDSGVSSFTSSAIAFTFNQTENVPSSVSVSENNVFSSGSVAKNGNSAVVTLNFHRAGHFAGYKAYYQDGYLIFRFTNIPSSLSGAKIYLDPGHGGMDSGSIPIQGMKNEATLNRDLAQKVASILRERGAEVKMTDTNAYVSLENRLSASQAYAPHLFVSLHHNSSTAPSAYGTEAWFFNPYSEIYADKISSGVAAALSTRDRGEKYGWYKVTTHMEFPAVLVECGFLSNIGEYDKLKEDSYQNSMAVAIADAIASAFGSI